MKDLYRQIAKEYFETAKLIRKHYYEEIARLKREWEQKLKELERKRQELLDKYKQYKHQILEDYENKRAKAFEEKRKLVFLRTSDPLLASKQLHKFNKYLEELEKVKNENLSKLEQWKNENLAKLEKLKKKINEYYQKQIEYLQHAMRRSLRSVAFQIETRKLNEFINKKFDELKQAKTTKEFEQKLKELEQISKELKIKELKSVVDKIKQDYYIYKNAVGLKGNTVVIYDPDKNIVKSVFVKDTNLLSAIREKIDTLKMQQQTKQTTQPTQSTRLYINLYEVLKKMYGDFELVNAYSDLEGQKVIFKKDGEFYKAVYNPWKNQILIFKEKPQEAGLLQQVLVEKLDLKKKPRQTLPVLDETEDKQLDFRKQLLYSYFDLVNRIDKKVPRTIDKFFEDFALRTRNYEVSDYELQKIKEWSKENPASALMKFSAGFVIGAMQDIPTLFVLALNPEEIPKAIKEMPKAYQELWKNDKAYALGQISEAILSSALLGAGLYKFMKLRIKPKLDAQKPIVTKIPDYNIPREFIDPLLIHKQKEYVKVKDIDVRNFVKNFREEFLAPQDYISVYSVMTQKVDKRIFSNVLSNYKIENVFRSSSVKMFKMYDTPKVFEYLPLQSLSFVVKVPEPLNMRVKKFILTKAVSTLHNKIMTDVITLKLRNSYIHKIFIKTPNKLDFGLGISFKIGNKLLTYVKTLSGQEILGLDLIKKNKLVGYAVACQLNSQTLKKFLKYLTKTEQKEFKRILPKLKKYKTMSVRKILTDLNQLIKQQKVQDTLTQQDALVSQAVAHKIFVKTRTTKAKVKAKTEAIQLFEKPKTKQKQIEFKLVGKDKVKIDIKGVKTGQKGFILLRKGSKFVLIPEGKTIAKKDIKNIHGIIIAPKSYTLEDIKKLVDGLKIKKPDLNIAPFKMKMPIVKLEKGKTIDVKVKTIEYTISKYPELEIKKTEEKKKKIKELDKRKRVKKVKKKKKIEKLSRARLKTKFYKKR